MDVFGLDIGSTSTKVVQLKKAGDAFKLLAAGITGMPPGVLGSDTEDNFAKVSEIIKKLITDARISSKQVVLSLPESKVFTRTISFSSLSDEEVASAVQWQAETYIPIPVSEAVISHQVIGRRRKGQEEIADVLLVAAPRTLVNKFVKIATGAGLEVVAVETELVAAARSIAPKQGVVMVVDVGASSTDIAVVNNKQLVVSRSIPTAGEALSRAVSQGLGVDIKQAEQYKRSYGLKEAELEGKVSAALVRTFSIIVEELKKAATYYTSELGGEAPKVIMVTGGSAGLPELVPKLTELTGFETIIADPFAEVQKDAEVAKNIAPYAPLYSVAVGLAERPL